MERFSAERLDDPGNRFSACTCFNCEAHSAEADTCAEAELKADADGWMIGLDPNSGTGDAVYACRQCVAFLIEPLPLPVPRQPGKIIPH